MKRRHIPLLALAGLSVAGGLLFLILRDAAPPPPEAEASPVLTVTRTYATPQRWPQTLAANGSLAAWQEIVISPEIGGQRLARVLVEVGDRVEKGQLLAQLAAGTLQADLDASRAALREAEVSAAEARRAADRARALQGTEVLSEEAIDQALAAADAAQARLAAARARVQADRLRLEYTEVRAPDAGIISVRSAVEGALVQAGEELMRLQRQGRLEWRAQLIGAELARVAPGQVARVALGGVEVDGRVRRVSPQVDPATRTGLVYVDLQDSPQARAGLFARGEFLLAEREVLTLPESAVLLRDGFSHVFRLEGDRVRQQKVTLGDRRDGRVEIREGLDADTPVVESGVGFLSDGVTVRLATARPATPVLAEVRP